MKYIHKENDQIMLEDYLKYLDSISKNLPKAARYFAELPFHYRLNDRRCPHDSWIEAISIKEISSGNRKERRKIEIEARFLGSYHDGYFTIKYFNVLEYKISAKLSHSSNNITGHGDWIVDEIILISPELVSHEIEFSSGDWKIMCGDIQYEWHALQ